MNEQSSAAEGLTRSETQGASYLEEIRQQRLAWERKPVIRKLYRRWYEQCVAQLSALRPVVEVGAGSGNFKEFFPSAISSDVFKTGPWIDLVMDAEHLGLRERAVGNILVFDVIHHLHRPVNFLRRAVGALKPGGRLVLCEPALSPWSRLVYGLFHHETVDLNWKCSATDDGIGNPDPGHLFANMAIPEILFFKRRAQTLEMLPSARLIEARKFAFLLYPLTGGFGYRSFVPEAAFSFLLRIEDVVTRIIPSSLTGMRMLIVLEKAGFGEDRS